LLLYPDDDTTNSDHHKTSTVKNRHHLIALAKQNMSRKKFFNLGPTSYVTYFDSLYADDDPVKGSKHVASPLNVIKASVDAVASSLFDINWCCVDGVFLT
jgi:hypothetical protein